MVERRDFEDVVTGGGVDFRAFPYLVLMAALNSSSHITRRAVALLIALTLTADTVIYGAFGGYGSFYEMFCGSVRNVLITWVISATIALLFSAIAGIIVLFGRLCLNAWKHPRTAPRFWRLAAYLDRDKEPD
jgi:hypothetical protein